MNNREKSTVDMDQELLRRCRAGDQDAFAELVERIERPLMNFIHRYIDNAAMAEDLFQETFLRVVRSIGEFRPTASLTTWIFTIARNLCLDQIKYQRRHRSVSLDAQRSSDGENVISFKEALEASVKPSHAAAADNEELRALSGAIGQLKPSEREVVILRVYLGMPYQDIAAIVDAPVGTLKYRVHEAVESLHRLMHNRKTQLGGLADEVS